jgi:hypothetical protein
LFLQTERFVFRQASQKSSHRAIAPLERVVKGKKTTTTTTTKHHIHLFPVAFIDHRLNCENVPCLHSSRRLVVGIMRHSGGAVKQLSNAMTTAMKEKKKINPYKFLSLLFFPSPIRSDYTQLVQLCFLGDHIANITIKRSRLANFDRLPETIIPIEKSDTNSKHVIWEITLQQPVLVHERQRFQCSKSHSDQSAFPCKRGTRPH